MPSPSQRRQLSIALVSKNGETLVESYLRRAGVVTHGTRSIERLAEMIPPAAAAVVVFADDFFFDVVDSALATVRARRPGVLVVVVTSDPASFATERATLILPKPVWGWTILDAIRAHLEPASARDGLVSRIGRLLSRRP